MFIIMPKNELYHHGVLGQKWGVRRYQNPDGSLTAKGAKHVAAQAKKAKYKHDVNRAAKKRTKKLESSHKAEMEKLRQEKDNEIAKIKADSSGPNSHEMLEKTPIREMSDKELGNALNRLQNEQKLKALLAESAPKSKPGLNSIMKKNVSKGANKLFEATMDGSKKALGEYVEKEMKKALGIDEPKSSLDLLDKVGIDNLSDKQRAAVAKAAAQDTNIRKWMDAKNQPEVKIDPDTSNPVKSQTWNYTTGSSSDSARRRRNNKIKVKVGGTRTKPRREYPLVVV